MRLYPLALIAGLLPIITINICYLWAASNGHVEWCIPYIDSCASISATGRQPPESYLYKALMIPSAMVLAAYWWYSCHWLVALGCTARKRRMLVLAIAIPASIGLILYSVMLGSIGEDYRVQRRTGVIMFFGFTYLNQLLTTHLLGHTQLLRQAYSRWLKGLEIGCLAILLVGLTSIALLIIDDDWYHRTDDAFEWIFTLLLCAHVLTTALLWKKTGFRSRLELS
jgi:hypothetical protein